MATDNKDEYTRDPNTGALEEEVRKIWWIWRHGQSKQKQQWFGVGGTVAEIRASAVHTYCKIIPSNKGRRTILLLKTTRTANKLSWSMLCAVNYELLG